MLDVRLFRNPRFSAASLAVSTIYFALFGTIFLMTQHMQVVLGYDALGAGLRTLPYAVVLIIVANTTPKLVGRLGTGRVISAGLLFVAGFTGAAHGVDRGHGYGADPREHGHVRVRHGPRDRAGDRIDHELGAARARRAWAPRSTTPPGRSAARSVSR